MTIRKLQTLTDTRYYIQGTHYWALSRKSLIRKDQARITKPIRIPLDTTGFALPKPGPSEKQQPKDGRKIESRQEYKNNKRRMWLAQNMRCVRVKDGKECGNFMPTPAFGHRHHLRPGGRGFNGSRREDRDTVLWCPECHWEEHNG